MNVDHLRVVRARDLVDHRLSEIAGFVQGVGAARGHNARALRMLVRWIESAEELHDIWPVSRWREAARWILDTRDPDPEAVEKTWRYIGHGSPKLIERVRRQRLRPMAEYDDPAPPIVFEGRVFVFTGIFESCSRGSPEEPGTGRGGDGGPGRHRPPEDDTARGLSRRRRAREPGVEALALRAQDPARGGVAETVQDRVCDRHRGALGSRAVGSRPEGAREVSGRRIVREVHAWWMDQGIDWWPVHGPLHDDVGVIGFEQRHWHVDWRFVDEDRREAVEAASGRTHLVYSHPGAALPCGEEGTAGEPRPAAARARPEAGDGERACGRRGAGMQTRMRQGTTARGQGGSATPRGTGIARRGARRPRAHGRTAGAVHFVDPEGRTRDRRGAVPGLDP